ncbi:50S ribosomal protein L14e [Candidatus Woesearchaeota archaeon]|nr:50S ribosomal protein L14e [Candidatus Woesearchaeota archaeon]MBL7050584.1 50S ribosomal protein L14e [Candidatus Woesearchaeota archaeon]
MYEIGRLCVKIAGRDAGKKCVIVDILDSNYVLIDGETRRRKCNLTHLEPLNQIIKIKKKASNVDIIKEFKKLKIEIKTTKPKKAEKRPKKTKKIKNNEEKTAIKTVKQTKTSKTSSTKEKKATPKKKTVTTKKVK